MHLGGSCMLSWLPDRLSKGWRRVQNDSFKAARELLQEHKVQIKEVIKPQAKKPEMNESMSNESEYDAKAEMLSNI